MSAGIEMSDAQPAARAQRRSMGPTLIASSMSLVLLGGTLAGLATLERDSGASIGIMLVILVNILLQLGFLGVEASRRPYSLHLMHLLSLFLFLGASSLYQYTVGYFGVAGPISGMKQNIMPAALTVTLWIVGYLAAYELHRLMVRTPRGPMVRFLERPLTLSRVRIVLALAVLSLMYLAATGLGGSATRGAALESMREFASQSGAGQYTSVWYMLNLLLFRAFSLVALLGGLIMLARNRRARREPLFLMLVVVTGIGTLLINNPFAAARMWLAITVIAFLSPFVLRRFRSGAPLVMIAIFGLTLLPSLHWSRYVTSFDELWRIFELASPVDYLSKSSDVDGLGMLAIVHSWTEIFGHRWGMQMLGALLFWVPRVLWPSKPIETGAMATGDLGHEFTNLSPPIMSEPLVDVGMLGVPFIGAVFGLILGRLDLTYWHGREDPATGLRVIDCIYPFWVGLVIFLTRGGSFAAMGWTMCFTVWILLFAVGARGVPRSTATAPVAPPDGEP